MADVEITVGDTYRPVEATLLDTDGSSMNLVGADVWFHAEDSFSDENVFDSEATIVDSDNGKVKYKFASSDVSEPGFLNARFRIVFGADTDSPEQQHFPNDEDEITIKINPE